MVVEDGHSAIRSPRPKKLNRGGVPDTRYTERQAVFGQCPPSISENNAEALGHVGVDFGGDFDARPPTEKM
jgi:hypothetical protein